ncbi:helix-turn-helix transcriptional regulator [Rhodospirillum rubrum]|nr:helix-turn-helix transcriptional regulator [Rhodospirillum rubrum]
MPLEVEVKPVSLQTGMMVSLMSLPSAFEATAYNDRPFIHFSCLFQGMVDVTFGGGAFRLEPGALLTSYAPEERFHLSFSGPYRTIELMVTPETLAALAGPQYDRIGDDIHRGFCVHHKANDRRVRDAAARLAWLMDEGQAPPLLIHAATLEFLAWHLASYRSAEDGEAVPLRERKLLLAARERLLQDLSAPPTIAELARETGLNQLKLKRGFKTVFGHSVYGLFQRERMDRARLLLQHHGVTETAMMLGYSNVSHFGAAFRKQFGILPREARRGALG